jgi:hypothetical protein
MSTTRKIIVEKLLQGYTIAALGPGQIRLRDAAGNPVMKITYRTFYWLKRSILRKKKNVFLVNLSMVRQLHGNCTAKRIYKGKKVPPVVQNTPPHKSSADRPDLGLTLF